MLLKIKPEATDLQTDQWAELIEVVGGNLRVKLTGADQTCLVAPAEIIGVQIADGLAIGFDVSSVWRMK